MHMCACRHGAARPAARTVDIEAAAAARWCAAVDMAAVEPGLKANQPKRRISVPAITDGMLCGTNCARHTHARARCSWTAPRSEAGATPRV